MSVNRKTHYTFQGHLQSIYYAHTEIEQREIPALLQQFNYLASAMRYVTPLLFVIDYTRSEYVVMTGGAELITARHPQEFLEGGIPLLIDLYQKDDFAVYNEHVFKRNAAFLSTQPRSEHERFIFSYNFRVRHKNGRYIPVYQRGSYITSRETGLPLYSLGMVMDLSQYKKDTLIYHTIEKTTVQHGRASQQLVQENYFYPCGEDQLLSVQERNVLGYIGEGLSSKQIADKLKIAENTVANHRKNMLRKTNTKNVAELIVFACRNGLL